MSKNVLGVTLYTLQEVGDLLEVSLATIYNYLKEGKLTPTKVGGKQYISEENFKKFLDPQG